MQRRAFLELTLATAWLPSAGCSDVALELPADDTQEDGREFFPQSVATGDPRESSVVIWTRLVDAERGDEDLALELRFYADSELQAPISLDGRRGVQVEAKAEHDGCVKVLVEGLSPGTVYYYRFLYRRDGISYVSRVGRTKTAPESDADVPVRFAVAACQDYEGRYYHSYRHMAEQDLDFFVHLGDYVYETVADPSERTEDRARSVEFSDLEGALGFEGRGAGYAAQSLDNYRELYRTVRSDPDLQRVHELFPMVAMPDDHEFSNDCWGAVATYDDGRSDERSLERRQNSDRAWFEYMPVDYRGPAKALDPTEDFPDDFTLYRAFSFGRNVELVMTDLRRYRSDHVIPEDAFPGAVLLSEAELRQTLGAVPDDALPYVDADTELSSAFKAAAQKAAREAGFTADRIAGLLSVPWLNELVLRLPESERPEPIAESAALSRGYAVHQLLKVDEFSAMGSRYLLKQAPFAAVSRHRYSESEGGSEHAMGSAQESWFLRTLRESTRTWKIWGNEYTFLPKLLDLSGVELAPPELRGRLLISAEDWDGMPNRREHLLSELAGVDNVIAVTGDIHAFFAGAPFSALDPERRIIEFVAGSISSTTWQAGISRIVSSDPNLPPGAALLAGLVGELLQDPVAQPNPHLGFVDLEHNGYAAFVADASELRVTFFAIQSDLVERPAAELEGPVAELFSRTEFRVIAGRRELEREMDGEFRRWDTESLDWR